MTALNGEGVDRGVAERAFADMKAMAGLARAVVEAAEGDPAASAAMGESLGVLRSAVAVTRRFRAYGDVEGFLEAFGGDYGFAVSELSRDMSLLDGALSEARSRIRVAARKLEDIGGLCDEALGWGR